MLDFTGFSGTWFLNLPLAYHSFFCYIKFAIRSISSVSVLSRTWQYRSIVICKELWPNIFCNVLGSIPFSIQFVAKVWRNPWGVSCSKNRSGFKAFPQRNTSSNIFPVGLLIYKYIIDFFNHWNLTKSETIFKNGITFTAKSIFRDAILGKPTSAKTAVK